MLIPYHQKYLKYLDEANVIWFCEYANEYYDVTYARTFDILKNTEFRQLMAAISMDRRNTRVKTFCRCFII